MSAENDIEEGGLPAGTEEAAEGRLAEQAAAQEDDSDPRELARQRDDYLARWQRAAADYKNLRRRTADDVENAVRRATVPLLTELLLVLDHLEMALSTPVESEDARALHAGVKLTRDQFLHVLERNDLERIATQHEDGTPLAFDPTVHEAVAAIEAPDQEPGAILDTIRRGYTWRGQVLRHAHVVVARGPLPETPSEASDPDPSRSDPSGS